MLWQDVKWAITMLRARRYRRKLDYSSRLAFDQQFPSLSSAGVALRYADAIYEARKKDYRTAKRTLRSNVRWCDRCEMSTPHKKDQCLACAADAAFSQMPFRYCNTCMKETPHRGAACAFCEEFAEEYIR